MLIKPIAFTAKFKMLSETRYGQLQPKKINLSDKSAVQEQFKLKESQVDSFVTDMGKFQDFVENELKEDRYIVTTSPGSIRGNNVVVVKAEDLYTNTEQKEYVSADPKNLFRELVSKVINLETQ